MSIFQRAAVWLLATLLCASSPVFAQIDPTVIGLPATTTLTGSELVPVYQGGARKAATAGQLGENIQLTARRIVDLANRASAPATMASPPTISAGTAYNNSTVQTSADYSHPTILATDSRVTTFGTALVDTGGGVYGSASTLYTGSSRGPGGSGWGQGFWFYGTTVDLGLNAQSGNAKLRIRVDGQEVAASGYSTPQDGPHYIKLTFATRAWRKIEFFFTSTHQIYGYNIGSTDRIRALGDDSIKATIFGDSWIAGANLTATGASDDPTAPLSPQFGIAMGLPHLMIQGMGGSGWVQADPQGHTKLDRINNGDLDVSRIGDQHLIVLHGSINDYQASTSALQAAVTTGVSAIMARQPRAIILFFSTFQSSSTTMTTGRNDAIKAGVLAAANGDPRVILIDTFASPTMITTTGGDANYLTDINPGGDGKHYTAGGAQFIAGRMKADAVAALAQLGATR